jgi:hypothetical protein
MGICRVELAVNIPVALRERGSAVRFRAAAAETTLFPFARHYRSPKQSGQLFGQFASVGFAWDMLTSSGGSGTAGQLCSAGLASELVSNGDWSPVASAGSAGLSGLTLVPVLSSSLVKRPFSSLSSPRRRRHHADSGSCKHRNGRKGLYKEVQ